MSQRRIRLFVLCLLPFAFLFVACGAVASAGPAQVSQRTVAEARARWRARPFIEYRLDVTNITTAGGDSLECTSAHLVSGQRVKAQLLHTCVPEVDYTVEGLFGRASLPNVRQCGPAFAGGCACLRVHEISVRFDPQLGYPTTIVRTQATLLQWWHPDYWFYLLHEGSQPWCARNAFTATQTTSVNGLTPQD